MVKFCTSTRIVALAIFVSPSLALGGGKLTDIPIEHQVILKDEWKPTKEQTARALNQIQIYLEHPRKGYRSDPRSMDDIRQILSHASTYYVQFFGKYPKGRKAIWCNFFTISLPECIPSGESGKSGLAMVVPTIGKSGSNPTRTNRRVLVRIPVVRVLDESDANHLTKRWSRLRAVVITCFS